MTCIRFAGQRPNDPVGFVCVNEQYLLKVGKRYIWMSWRNYTGHRFTRRSTAMKFTMSQKTKLIAYGVSFIVGLIKNKRGKYEETFTRSP